MKKIIWTFLITLVLVIIGGAIFGYYYLQKNPAKLHQFVGCEANTVNQEQQTFNQQLGEAVKTLLENQKIISQQIQQIQLPVATEATMEATPEQTEVTLEENTTAEEETTTENTETDTTTQE